MPLRPVDPEVSFTELEVRTLEHWEKTSAFERSSAERVDSVAAQEIRFTHNGDLVSEAAAFSAADGGW